MAAKKRTKKTKRAGAAVGLGLAALGVVAAAGSYFLYGTKQGAKRRKHIRGWMLKAKGEVLEKLEGLKRINEEDYAKVVDTVLTKYKKLKSVNAKEAEDLRKELRSHWNELSKKVKASASRKAKKKNAARRKKK